MHTSTAGDVLEKAKEYNVKFIRLQFTDIFGVFKNIAVTVEELERALAGQIPFDSSVIEGSTGSKEADIYLVPDPATFQIFPWRPREGAVARLICDVHDAGHKPFAACSRSILKNVLKQAAEIGYKFQAGADIEFFLFNLDERGKPTVVTHDHAGYCDLTPVDLGENVRRDTVLTLEEMGFDISSSHHEFAPGQHEIGIKDDNPLTMADKIVTFKFVVRTIAQRHGLHASFMPKPLAGHSGSGMNLKLSMWQQGENAFYSPDDELGLSAQAYSFMAGIINHADALTAVTNPLVNSYKRLVPSDAAPYLAAWSQDSRSTIIRVPAPRERDTAVVLRHPDPACNPYLAAAAALKCGLDGIKKEQRPSAEADAKRLPGNLGEALKALAGDEVVAQALGGSVYSRYLAAKTAEWNSFQSEVHQWELDRYLTQY